MTRYKEEDMHINSPNHFLTLNRDLSGLWASQIRVRREIKTWIGTQRYVMVRNYFSVNSFVSDLLGFNSLHFMTRKM